MASKIDKKVLVGLAVALLVILALGFLVYGYLVQPAPKVQNSVGGAQTEQGQKSAVENNNQTNVAVPQVQLQAGGVQVQEGNGGGTLSVCSDKCGDGVCQKTDTNCSGGDGLNCVCPETPQECPQDCK